MSKSYYHTFKPKPHNASSEMNFWPPTVLNDHPILFGKHLSFKKYAATLLLWQHSLLWYCYISLTRTQVLWKCCLIPTLLVPNSTRNYLQMQQMYYVRWFNMDIPHLKSPLPILAPLIHPAPPNQILFTSALFRPHLPHDFDDSSLPIAEVFKVQMSISQLMDWLFCFNYQSSSVRIYTVL